MVKTVLHEDEFGIVLRRVNLGDWESMGTETLKGLCDNSSRVYKGRELRGHGTWKCGCRDLPGLESFSPLSPRDV